MLPTLIAANPTEQNNLAKAKPAKLQQLMALRDEHNGNAVEGLYPMMMLIAER